jgi:hypothetical protein
MLWTFAILYMAKVSKNFGLDENILYDYSGIGEFVTISEQSVEKETEDQLTNNKGFTHKQQILLLHKLGFFDLPAIEKLNDLKKGKLFSILLGKNVDNTENLIRYRHTQKKGEIQSSYFLYNPKNVEKVTELLKELGIEK